MGEQRGQRDAARGRAQRREGRGTSAGAHTQTHNTVSRHSRHSTRPYASMPSAANGFAISSVPVVGTTSITLVPRHTHSPSGRVASVTRIGSSGSGEWVGWVERRGGRGQWRPAGLGRVAGQAHGAALPAVSAHGKRPTHMHPRALTHTRTFHPPTHPPAAALTPQVFHCFIQHQIHELVVALQGAHHCQLIWRGGGVR